MTVIYPAVFHKEENAYWVEFPDLPGCQSFGDTLESVLAGAREAMTAYCVTLLEQGRKIPPASGIETMRAEKGSFLSLVECNLITKSRSVKKTLTIPSWLNEMAEASHVNFSSILQDALIDKLHISE